MIKEPQREDASSSEDEESIMESAQIAPSRLRKPPRTARLILLQPLVCAAGIFNR